MSDYHSDSDGSEPPGKRKRVRNDFPNCSGDETDVEFTATPSHGRLHSETKHETPQPGPEEGEEEEDFWENAAIAPVALILTEEAGPGVVEEKQSELLAEFNNQPKALDVAADDVLERLMQKQVRPFGIRKIDVSRARKRLGAAYMGVPIPEIVTGITNTRASTATEDNFIQEVVELSLRGHGNFTCRIFVSSRHRKPALQAALGDLLNVAEDTSNSFVLFLFREQGEDGALYALTSGHAYHIVEQYTDFEWPKRFARAALDPTKVYETETEHLFGAVRRQVTSYDVQRHALPVSHSCQIFSSIKMPFRADSFIRTTCAFFNEVEADDVVAKVQIGQIRLQHKISIPHYAELIQAAEASVSAQHDEYDNLSQGLRRAFLRFEQVEKISDYDERQAVEQLLCDQLNAAYKNRRHTEFTLGQKHISSFMQACETELILWLRSDKQKFKSFKFSSFCTLHSFEEKLFNKYQFGMPDVRKLEVELPNEKKSWKLVDLIEGTLMTPHGLVAVQNHTYYRFSTNCLTRARLEFRDLLLHTAIDERAKLGRHWPAGMKEGPYNETYLLDEGYIVGDRVAPRQIEIFDLVKVTEDTTYIYHVKEGFAGTTRDAMDQLVNSVEMIHDARFSSSPDSVLDEWYDKATKPTGDSEYRLALAERIRAIYPEADDFKQLFTEKRLIFVFAFRNDKEREFDLMSETNRPNFFSEQELSEGDLQKLKDAGFLDKYGCLTGKIDTVRRQQFCEIFGETTDEAPDVLREKLQEGMFGFKSAIAMLTILRARERLCQYNYGFQIFQIPRNSEC